MSATMLENSISNGFRCLLSSLDHFADDLKLQCAEASLVGDLPHIERGLNGIRSLDRLRTEIVESRDLLLGSQSPIKNGKKKAQKNGQQQKGERTRLSVKMAGVAIEGSSSAEIFALTLERIGLERVAGLSLTLSGVPLVSREAAAGYQAQLKRGGWFVATHANNVTKQKMLESIAEKLDYPLSVDII